MPEISGFEIDSLSRKGANEKMKASKRKGILSMFLCLTLVLCMCGMTAFAQDGQADPAACGVTEGCPLGTGHDGACQTSSISDERICAGPEGCTENAHDEGCPLYAASVEKDEAVQAVQERIDALPDVITKQNADEVIAQLDAIDEAKRDLTDEQADKLDISRYAAASESLTALAGRPAAYAPALYTVTNYGFSVNPGSSSNYVTSANAADVLGDSTVRYDADTNTLTLTNCTLSNQAPALPAIYVPNGQSLILELVGTNTITANQGISVTGNLTITGDGCLQVTGGTYALFAAKNLMIKGPTVTAASNGSGAGAIQAQQGTVTIKNSPSVTATNEAGRGISGQGGVQIADSKVTATVTASSGLQAGIHAGGTGIVLTHSTVEASSTSGVGLNAAGAGGIHMTNSTVCAASSSKWDSGIMADGDVTISGGKVTATAGGSQANAICSFGAVSIRDGADVTARATASDSYPALYGETGILISGSTVKAQSEGDAGVFSPAAVDLADGADVTASGYWAAIRGNGGVEISDSRVSATSAEDTAIFSQQDVAIAGSVVKATGTDGVAGMTSNQTVSASDSWIATSGDDQIQISDSVLIKGTTGSVIGNATVPMDATIPEGTTLTIPSGASLTVPEGTTLTNHGTTLVEGTFINHGTVTCDHHIGGAASCTAKAVCDVCGEEYGDLTPHTLTQTAEKAATCTQAGQKAYWTCSVCDKLFSDENGADEIQTPIAVEAIGHSYTHYVSNHDATCTADGTETALCDHDCGTKDTRTQAGSMLEHTYGDWTVTQEATATQAGSREKTCSVCGHRVTETLAATGGVAEPDAPKTGGTTNSKVAQTGDASRPWLYGLLLLGAGACLADLAISRRARAHK